MALTLKASIGARVRAARTRRKLTQQQVADQIERTTEAVSNIERGVSLPGIDTLERLSEVLEVPLKEFFDEAGYFRQLTRRRFNLEAKLRETCRKLRDEDLELAVAIVEVMAARK